MASCKYEDGQVKVTFINNVPKLHVVLRKPLYKFVCQLTESNDETLMSLFRPKQPMTQDILLESEALEQMSLCVSIPDYC